MGSLAQYFVSILAIVAIAVPLALFRTSLSAETAALVLVLLVLLIATAFGSRYALVASIVAALVFNYFFLPPFFTFRIAGVENWFAFAAFVVTALVAGQLSTYAKRQAREAEERRVEIEKLYTELQSAFDQASEAEALRRSEKLKSALLDAITHDLRTPLTSIKASATTLLESKGEKLLDEEGEVELLEIIDEESDRLNGFIEGMVGLAQIESNALHLRRSWTRFQDLVNSALERAATNVGDRKVIVEFERQMPLLFVDARSISEVLYLLVDNAAKYSPDNSDIRVSARVVGSDSIEIAVEDRGIGIPVDAREKVFQKFVRLDGSSTPSSSNGLGLGLAIARGIVESQGGKIWIEDGKDGYRTRFVLSLPLESEKELVISE